MGWILSIAIAYFKLQKLIRLPSAIHKIQVANLLDTVAQLSIDGAIQRQVPENPSGMFSFDRLIANSIHHATGSVDIFERQIITRREPVAAPEEKILRSSPLRMADWHAFVDVPSRKGAVSVQYLIALKELETEVIATVIRQARNVQTGNVAFDDRPE